MTEVKHYCDKCNERIEAPDRTLMTLKTGPFRFDRPTVELCVSCCKAVFDFISARGGNCTAPRPRKTKALTA